MQQRLDAEQRDRAQERTIMQREVEELRARLNAAEADTMQANEDRLRLTNDNQVCSHSVEVRDRRHFYRIFEFCK